MGCGPSAAEKQKTQEKLAREQRQAQAAAEAQAEAQRTTYQVAGRGLPFSHQDKLISIVTAPARRVYCSKFFRTVSSREMAAG